VVTCSNWLLSDAEPVRLMIEEAVLAEAVGIDSFNIGEHYRQGMVDSAGRAATGLSFQYDDHFWIRRDFPPP
jgi:hypothetical protein